jgi:hypothetical protein
VLAYIISCPSYHKSKSLTKSFFIRIFLFPLCRPDGGLCFLRPGYNNLPLRDLLQATLINGRWWRRPPNVADTGFPPCLPRQALKPACPL